MTAPRTTAIVKCMTNDPPYHCKISNFVIFNSMGVVTRIG